MSLPVTTLYSEITRIQQAKADLRDALDSKGVTVDKDATIDTYAKSISEIPSGGEGRLIIWYTTSDGSLITPDDYAVDASSNYFKDSIVSNTYSNGQGVIVFKDGVTDVPARAFCRGCGKMTSIRFSKDLTSIGRNYTSTSENSLTFDDDADIAQGNGAALSSIYFEGTTVPEIAGKHNFGCIPWLGSCTIYVPESAFYDYAGWTTDSSKVKFSRYADASEYGEPKVTISLGVDPQTQSQ